MDAKVLRKTTRQDASEIGKLRERLQDRWIARSEKTTTYDTILQSKQACAAKASTALTKRQRCQQTRYDGAETDTHEADMIPNKHLDMTHPARNPAQSLSFKIKIQDQADVQSMARPR
jgi:hypothetical protein